jgi:hypothetical protein
LSSHDHYEELCALAVTGQASEKELADLRTHLEDCPSCRGTAYDFSAISAQGLSTLAAKRLRPEIPDGMTQRFIARAHSEGIEISTAIRPQEHRSDRRRSRFRMVVAGAGAATILLCLALAVFGPRFLKPAVIADGTAGVTPPLPANTIQTSADHSGKEEELVELQQRLGAMEKTVNAQRADLEASKNNINALISQLSEAQQQSSGFEKEDVDQQGKVKLLEAELQKANSERDANAVALATQEDDLRRMQKEVSDQAEVLKEQQALTAKESDVRDLVVARNLHIIDVHDRDGNGKSQRTFGRIFYTEGKSLIFYAYDLSEPHRLNAKVSFHVWGERLGSEKPIRNLGILHNDDVADGRWVLTFDDPQVLAQIDSVFVTAEPSQKTAKEPRGERILFAFLGGTPNHP